MICEHCGVENIGDNSFCSRCGNSLGWTCESCTFVNKADALFCGGCGRASSQQNPNALKTKKQGPDVTVNSPRSDKMNNPSTMKTGMGTQTTNQQQPEIGDAFQASTAQIRSEERTGFPIQNNPINRLQTGSPGFPARSMNPGSGQFHQKHAMNAFSQKDPGPFPDLGGKLKSPLLQNQQVKNTDIEKKQTPGMNIPNQKPIQTGVSELQRSSLKSSDSGFGMNKFENNTSPAFNPSIGLNNQSPSFEQNNGNLSGTADNQTVSPPPRNENYYTSLVEQLTEIQIQRLLDESVSFKMAAKDELNQDDINKVFEE